MKGVITLALMLNLVITDASAMKKTICGLEDDRIASDDPFIGKLINDLSSKGGCTATLISENCAISAGHCDSVIKYVEFNIPVTVNGVGHAKAKDRYEVDKSFYKFIDAGPGNDWAVFKIKKNSKTGLYPGRAQGGNYYVSFDKPLNGTTLKITGYGADAEETKTFTQQTHDGMLVSIKGSRMLHRVDTMGGNSGSSIINAQTNEIVGIHTHGGCSIYDNSANQATSISTHPQLKAAIKACLKD